MLLLGVSLVPIIFVLLISYRQSASTITRQTGELIEANLEQSSGNVQNFLDTFENLIQDIYTDQTYVDNLKPINIWDSSGFYLAKHKIEENLQNIVYINKNILGIAVTGIYGDVCFYDSMTLSGAESFCFDLDNIRNNEMVKQAYAEKQTVYSRTYHKLDTRYGEKDYFYVAHQLTDFNDYKEGPVGCILLCVDEKALCDVYKQGSTKSNITFVVNRYGDIISYPEGNYGGKKHICRGGEKREKQRRDRAGSPEICGEQPVPSGRKPVRPQQRGPEPDLLCGKCAGLELRAEGPA